jgi:hypothetical protein
MSQNQLFTALKMANPKLSTEKQNSSWSTVKHSPRPSGPWSEQRPPFLLKHHVKKRRLSCHFRQCPSLQPLGSEEHFLCWLLRTNNLCVQLSLVVFLTKSQPLVTLSSATKSVGVPFSWRHKVDVFSLKLKLSASVSEMFLPLVILRKSDRRIKQSHSSKQSFVYLEVWRTYRPNVVMPLRLIVAPFDGYYCYYLLVISSVNYISSSCLILGTVRDKCSNLSRGADEWAPLCLRFA